MKALILCFFVILPYSVFADREHDLVKEVLDEKILLLESYRDETKKSYESDVKRKYGSLIKQNYSLIKLDYFIVGNEIIKKERNNNIQLKSIEDRFEEVKNQIKSDRRNIEDHLHEFYALLSHADYIWQSNVRLNKQTIRLQDLHDQLCNQDNIIEQAIRFDPTRLEKVERFQIQLAPDNRSVYIGYSGSFGGTGDTNSYFNSSGSNEVNESYTQFELGHQSRGFHEDISGVASFTIVGGFIGDGIAYGKDKALHRREKKILSLVEDIYNYKLNTLGRIKNQLQSKIKEICEETKVDNDLPRRGYFTKKVINSQLIFDMLKFYISNDYPNILLKHYTYLLDRYYDAFKESFVNSIDSYVNDFEVNNKKTDNYVEMHLQSLLDQLASISVGQSSRVLDDILDHILLLDLKNDTYNEDHICEEKNQKNQINNNWFYIKPFVCEEIL